MRWADMDLNAHMHHSAYADYVAQARLNFLADHGFPRQRFGELTIGPVLFREETRFLKEVPMGETIRVASELGGLQADGALAPRSHALQSRRANGRRCWLDLRPPELIASFAAIHHARTRKLFDGLSE